MNRIILTLVCAISVFGSALAQEFATDQNHKGYVALDQNYAVFPEGRVNNALYREKSYIIGDLGISITKLFSTPYGVLLSGEDDEGLEQLLAGDMLPKVQIAQQKGAFIALKTPDGNKVFRLYQGALQSVLPRFRSLSIPIRSESGTLAMYFITGSAVDSNDQTLYSFRLYYLKKNQKAPVRVPRPLQSTSASLGLKWSTADVLSYTLSGRKYKLNLQN